MGILTMCLYCRSLCHGKMRKNHICRDILCFVIFLLFIDFDR